MNLYLVRHGETESNLERRYQGWSESPLSAKGLLQAKEAAYYLATKGICGLYCSDLQRARHTARIIGAASGLAPTIDTCLREIHFGEWEGRTYEEIEAGWGDAVRHWLDDPFRQSPPGGETVEEVSARMSGFVKRVSSVFPAGSAVAAVAHGGSIRALLYDALKLDSDAFWQVRIDNASVSLFESDGSGLRVVYHNRSDYLGAL